MWFRAKTDVPALRHSQDKLRVQSDPYQNKRLKKITELPGDLSFQAKSAGNARG